MQLDELVEVTVGQERYRDACGWAWRTAAGTGGRSRTEWPGDLAFVPHEMSDLWDLDELPLAQRLDLALALYRAMPCYANTMYLVSWFDEFGPAERRTLWDAYRDALASDDDRLADPVAYSLAVDFFERANDVEEAWHETTRQDVAPSPRRLTRVLREAGPVPWRVKAPLLDSLLGSLEWHRGVLDALEDSAFRVDGDIDQDAARAWLGRLRLPPAELERLRSAVRSA